MVKKFNHFEKIKYSCLNNKIVAFAVLFFLVIGACVGIINQVLPLVDRFSPNTQVDIGQYAEEKSDFETTVTNRVVELRRLRPFSALSNEEVKIVKKFVEYFVSNGVLKSIGENSTYEESDLLIAICRMVRSSYLIVGSDGVTYSLLCRMLDEYVSALTVVEDKEVRADLIKDCMVLSMAVNDYTTYSAFEVWEARLSGGLGISAKEDKPFPEAETRFVFVCSSEGNDENSGLSPSDPKRSLRSALSLARVGSQDWVLLKRGGVFRLSGDVPYVSGKDPIDTLVVAAYGNGSNPQLLISSNIKYEWLDRRTIRFFDVDLIQ